MTDHYGLVQLLTAGAQSPSDQARRVNDFAVEMGWRPSDLLQLPDASEFSTAHLIVEHGLENTAVISFLRQPYRHSSLSSSQQRCLLNASYNNLVDWHINVDLDDATFVYNRYRPPDFHVVRQPISRTNVETLRSRVFQGLADEHPVADVPSLDNALIATVSLWKRRLAVDFGGLENHNLSALFNAIIFLRAVEDNDKRRKPSQTQTELLPDILESNAAHHLGFRQFVERSLAALNIREVPPSIVDLDALAVFENVELATLSELLADFYRNRYSRYYGYDFSLMSKHALSRIYEHYVSVLRLPYSPQISLFPRLPEERLERSYGNVYTPEFIARFFARYLRKESSLRSFQRMRVADPACGSGIFLRVLLELQSEALFNDRTTESLRRLFDGVIGIDVDVNACNAARLSLSLLSLVLTDQLPQTLQIIEADSVEYFSSHPELMSSMDAVIANPPFVNLEQQSPQLKDRVAQILGGRVQGRQDVYLAILKVALDLIKPGGFGLFVLPEGFLKSKNAGGMRDLLSQSSWIRCLVDLTAVRVFEDVGVYVILLIFQKKPEYDEPAPQATIIRCQDLVGEALEVVLDDRTGESQFYTIFNNSQDAFSGSDWKIAPPSAAMVMRKYEDLGELQQFAKVRLGMITGLDEVFVVPTKNLDLYDPELFVPLLSDREMEAYRVPKAVKTAVFFPFSDKVPLEEGVLRRKYSKTWHYLLANRERLQARKAVINGEVPWWRPERPRQPKHLLQAKIVTPHLVLAPRFGLDLKGRVAVSHSPYLTIEHLSERGAEERDQLMYLLGVLNSTPAFWYITQRSHVYQRGYSRLEVATLSQARIPGFWSVETASRTRVIRLVEARLTASGGTALGIEHELDDLVADLYGLSTQEKRFVGVQT